MKKLPVVGTSAATTAFCFAEILGPAGTKLYVDGNGKITAANGTLDNPKPNAFSLRNKDDCPGSTPTCRASCYVEGLKKFAADTYTLYEHNATEIRRILEDDAHASAWVDIFGDWITANAAGGFRWHVSGDVYSAAYAEWIADVCAASPTVSHWIYTRSFGPGIGPTILDTLARQATIFGGNLAINLSADVDNYDHAKAAAIRVGHGDGDGKLVRVCYMATGSGDVPDDLVEGDVIFPDYPLRGATPEGQAWFAALSPDYKSFTCPVDMQGKSERRRCGPCNRCLT